MDDNRHLRMMLICFALAGSGLLVAVPAAAADPKAPSHGGQSHGAAPAQARPGNDPDPAPGTMPEAARLERIAAKRPADTATHLAAARHYLEQSYGADSRLVDAQRHANAVLKSEPRNFDALMVSGDIENRRHRPDLAAQYYRNATLANPSSKEALLSLSGALDQSGDHAGAQAAFAKYRELSGMGPGPAVKSADAKSN